MTCKTMQLRRLVILTLLISGDLKAQPLPDLKELGSWLLTNPINSKNAHYDSFTIESDFFGLTSIYQYIRGQAPSYLVMDEHDSTPLAAGGEGMAMFYDVVQGKIIVLRDQYFGMQATAHYSPAPNRSFLDLKGCLHPEMKDAHASLEMTSEVPVSEIPGLTYEIQPIGGEEYLARCAFKRAGRLVEMKVLFLGNPKPSRMKSLVIAAPAGMSSSVGGKNALKIGRINQTQTAPKGSFPDRRLQDIAEFSEAAQMGSDITRGFFDKNAKVRKLLREKSSDSEKRLQEIVAETRKCLQEAKEKIQATYESPSFLQDTFSRLPDSMLRRLYDLKGGDGKSEKEFLQQFRADEFRGRLEDPGFRRQLAQDYILLTSLIARESTKSQQTTLPTSWADSIKQIDDQLKNLDISNIRARDQKLSAELRDVFKEFSSQMERSRSDDR